MNNNDTYNDIIIEELLDLTLKRRTSEIKELLTNIDKNRKGVIFEEYMKKLYEGNGWIVKSTKHLRYDFGADLLIYHPKNQDQSSNTTSVSMVVQLKNQTKPLTVTKTREEIRRFEEESSKQYNCGNFILVSIEGFTKDAYSLLFEFNTKLYNWDYIEILILSYDERKSVPEIDLYNHNEKTYKKVVELFDEFKRVCVIQATGTGKSLLIAKLLTDMFEENKVVLAPKQFILDQLQNHAIWSTDNTIFMTYSKAMNLSTDEIKKINPSLLVLDEFHRAGAEEWSKGVERIIGLQENMKIFGTSATPKRYLEGRDMSIELFDSIVATKLSLSEAISRKILPPPRYISAIYTLKEVTKELMGKIETSHNTVDDKADKLRKLENLNLNFEKVYGIPNIIRKFVKSDDNKFIVFCRDKDHLREAEWMVKSWFQKSGLDKRIETLSIYYEEPNSEKTLDNFRNAKRKDVIYLLFSIEKLTEGIHINDLSGVILLRKTASGNVYLQQIGRAFSGEYSRRPIIFDFVNNYKDLKGNFIAGLNDAIEKENIKRAKAGLPSYHPDVLIHDQLQEIKELFTSIEISLYDLWDAKYQQLIEYKERNGDCLVPSTYSQNQQLAHWVNAQRMAYQRNQLEEEKIDKLEQINFVWSARDYYWETMFKELCLYKEANGDCLVPDKYDSCPKLSNWVRVQRSLKLRGVLSDDKQKLLNDVGFIWDVLDTRWNDLYERLRKYMEQSIQNKFDVSIIPNDIELTKWIKQQRVHYREKKLSDGKISRLNLLGFVWDPYKSRWEKAFEELIEYKEVNGNCLVPQSFENKQLANWVSVQRENYKKGKLSNEKIQLLNEEGFVWDPYTLNWDRMYNRLLEYIKREGDTLVPRRYKEDAELGNWVSVQREAYRRRKLAKNKIIKLNEVKFIWEPNDYKWNLMYQKLLHYVEQNGNVSIPRRGEFYRLAMWLKKQRALFKDGSLKSKRYLTLKNIGVNFTENKKKGS
ncbi:Helicase associated domain protein [Ornithinibacillus californiensis]|uniref:Helicase associated domain protein n=1 Tax=Ornithinibacillus californiensis TaxID=161536 RepID=UPI00064DAF05|nr:Helicase associated domain protein [Ornithinibacillus californiensis]